MLFNPKITPHEQANELVNGFQRTWFKKKDYTQAMAVKQSLEFVNKKMKVFLNDSDTFRYKYWRAVKAELEIMKTE